MMMRVALALGLGIASAAGWTQMVQPSLYMGPQISFSAHRAQTQSAERSRRAQDPRQRATPAAAVPMVYRPDPARRRVNLARFLAKTQAVDPAGAKALAARFAQSDFIEDIGKAGAAHGLRIDNVADAYATYWINAYQATEGSNATPSRPKLVAVRDQAARALSATAAFRGATDAAKQEMAEALWVQAALLDVAVEQSKGDAEKLRAVGNAAATAARSMGLDFRQMRLTEGGFVAR